METKPGVMIYFETMKVLDRLNDRQAGILFRAIMEYGQTQKQPQLPNPLHLVWPLVQIRLDTDDERYYRISQKRKYAAYVRWATYHGQEPLPLDEWLGTLDRCEPHDPLLAQ